MNINSTKLQYTFGFVFYTAYQLIFYKHGLNLWDEGALAYGALRFLNGEIPLVDFGFDGYPPGRYFLAASFFKIFGVNLTSLRLLFVILTSIMAILFYHISKNIMDKNFAVISTLLLLSAPSMYYNRLFPICTVINIYFISRYINSARKFDFALSILAALLTLLFKTEIGAVSIFILILVLILQTIHDHKKYSFNFKELHFNYKILMSMIVFFAVASIVVAISINLPAKAYKFVFQMSSIWGNPFPSILSTSGMEFPSFKEFFDISLFYLPIIVYTATVILLFKRKLFSDQKIFLNKSNMQIFVLLLFGIGTYGLVLWRVGFDNLLRVLPVFYILLCYFLCLFYRKIGGGIYMDWLGSKSAIRNFVVSIPILLFPALFIVNFNFHHGFYAGSIGELRNNHIYINLNRARIFAHPMEAIWIEDIVSYIKQTTTEDEPIFALPLNPIWYFLSERKNPTAYDWVLPQTIKVLDKEQNIVDQLKNNIPKLIIYADIAIDGKEERRLSNYAPKVFEFILKNYKLEKIVGPFQILKVEDS
ncbi:MAG: glycosyltransferase family 39 protein [Nitrospinota bacterium]|jgi:hypothetical protein|nr:glycosyltransferase family 39 protein [Nitrospinota bacterium]MDP7580850.1 glycosyltransferase family 39 protein [Nitrospinota bacterium]HJN02455.1 glycosyltransferase family 39 protein [Nitrospinota bacterium]